MLIYQPGSLTGDGLSYRVLQSRLGPTKYQEGAQWNELSCLVIIIIRVARLAEQ